MLLYDVGTAVTTESPSYNVHTSGLYNTEALLTCVPARALHIWTVLEFQQLQNGLVYTISLNVID